MKIKDKLIVIALVALWAIGLLAVLLYGTNIAVLDPKGVIASQERELIVTATLLSLIVVVPVFIMTFMIAWKYRSGNHKKTKYRPDWDGDRRVEATMWSVPLILITILSVMIWTSSHRLDPFQALASDKKPVRVQVIALRWKWLFIYPDYNIATVNYVQFPSGTPINFEITADAPMNSFWIPQLGGQIYAMEGMSTQLHLMANQSGEFRGSSANISGRGFAGMDFKAVASSEREFDLWVEQTVKKSGKQLDARAYQSLAAPSENNVPTYYASAQVGLYDTVMMKFMPHTHHRGIGH